MKEMSNPSNTENGVSRIQETTPLGARNGGERSEPERSAPKGVANDEIGLQSVSPPDPEVPEKPVRRRFSAKYKLNILKKADAVKGIPGEIGRLLRKESLYSSQLSTWRKQRDAGTLEALSSKSRGRKAKKKQSIDPEVKELRSENRRLRRRLEKVELMLDIQKKTSELLGIPLTSPETDESEESD
jgi:transposase-like protein